MPSFLAFFLFFTPPTPEAWSPPPKEVCAGKGESARTPHSSSMGVGGSVSNQKVSPPLLPRHVPHWDIRIPHEFLKHRRQGERREGEVCELGRENGPDLDSAKVTDQYNRLASWIHFA